MTLKAARLRSHSWPSHCFLFSSHWSGCRVHLSLHSILHPAGPHLSPTKTNGPHAFPDKSPSLWLHYSFQRRGCWPLPRPACHTSTVCPKSLSSSLSKELWLIIWCVKGIRGTYQYFGYKPQINLKSGFIERSLDIIYFLLLFNFLPETFDCTTLPRTMKRCPPFSHTFCACQGYYNYTYFI